MSIPTYSKTLSRDRASEPAHESHQKPTHRKARLLVLHTHVRSGQAHGLDGLVQRDAVHAVRRHRELRRGDSPHSCTNGSARIPDGKSRPIIAPPRLLRSWNPNTAVSANLRCRREQNRSSRCKGLARGRRWGRTSSPGYVLCPFQRGTRHGRGAGRRTDPNLCSLQDSFWGRYASKESASTIEGHIRGRKLPPMHAAKPALAIEHATECETRQNLTQIPPARLPVRTSDLRLTSSLGSRNRTASFEQHSDRLPHANASVRVPRLIPQKKKTDRGCQQERNDRFFRVVADELSTQHYRQSSNGRVAR